MDNKDLKNIVTVFNIRDIKTEYYEEPIYSNFPLDSSPFHMTHEVYRNRTLYYNIRVDEKFMYMLADYVKFVEHNNIHIPTHPRNLYDFFDKMRETYEKNIKEQHIQNKYPELKEIQQDYEITKALVVDKNDM